MKPTFPQQCANINSDMCDVIYPDDEVFYIDTDGFYFCSQSCLKRTWCHSSELKTMAVKNKKRAVARCRLALGL